MNFVIFIEYLFESIPDYRKMVWLIFLIEDDKSLMKEILFIKNAINQISLEFKNILFEQYENYIEYVKEESIIEKFFNKWIKNDNDRQCLDFKSFLMKKNWRLAWFWISKWKPIFLICLKILDMKDLLVYCWVE